jgi:integrase
MAELLRAGPSRRRTQPPPLVAQHTARARLLRVLRGLWASSTWAQRRQLWRRFGEFCAANGMPLTDETAAMFIVSLAVRPATRHAYASALSAVLGRLGQPTQTLAMLSAALRAQGALIPHRQARPATREAVKQLLPLLNRRDAAAIMLCWKTASRWSDVQRLLGRQVLRATAEEIVIDFSDRTKTSRSRPFAPQLLVVVAGRWTAEIAAVLRQLRPNESLTTLTTHAVAELLAPLRLTAHSLKRGALDVVATAVADGIVDASVLPLLARHHTESPLIQESVIRYVSNKVALARALGTQHATRLL